MTTAIYIASPEGRTGRNAFAYSLVSRLHSSGKTTVVFRPIARRHDPLGTALSHAANPSGSETAYSRGVCPCHWRDDPDASRGDVVSAYHGLLDGPAGKPDVVVIVGMDGSPTYSPDAFANDCAIASDLHANLVLAICGRHRDARELRDSVDVCLAIADRYGADIADVAVTGCDGSRAKELTDALSDLDVPTQAIPSVEFDSEDESTWATATEKCAASITDHDLEALLSHSPLPTVTPYAFQSDLVIRAAAQRKRIVLPEGMEGRILAAADYLLRRNIVDITLIGERDEILAKAHDMGLSSIESATVVSLSDPRHRDAMVERLCQLRAHKGMTPPKAQSTLADPSYFGTMLVQMGLADGLVSGSITSTATTVRPALQVIRTKPDASLVSGAFIMCLPDHPVVFADCAITLNPTAAQLADIAIQSARTARNFGIDPRVGMLSYSTLGSGSGPDVDLVTEATNLVALKDPDLPVVGPIQFDAAWSPEVARVKAPSNEVAGHVNVFVFPDLSAGNITYKAVQRSSGALAVGPVLQGLNKPVNDLSRGASVKDIINTIALTAVQAQQ